MYLYSDQITINSHINENETDYYGKGYLFTRIGKGVMNKTRSLRVNLKKFELNSENRRILRKNAQLKIESRPLPFEEYSWKIHKIGKEFYTTKFGEKTMSASKIKEMFTEPDKSNMNSVFVYKIGQATVGYCLCYKNEKIVHYSYPFYDLEFDNTNLGIGMMTLAILWAKENKKDFIYLGSVATPESRYKLQFKGLEWYDLENDNWSDDISSLKKLLQHSQSPAATPSR